MDSTVMTRRAWWLQHAAIGLLVLIQLASLQVADCAAQIGLAEWTIKTPGKNFVADSDLFADQGVCLHRPAKPGGVLDEKAICVSHIQWWMYSGNHIVGKAKKGFFIFDERSRETRYYDNQVDLDAGMTELKLTKAASKRLTPQDGWNIAVGSALIDAYQQRLKDLNTGSGDTKDLEPAERELVTKSMEQMLRTLQAQVAVTTEKLKSGQKMENAANYLKRLSPAEAGAFAFARRCTQCHSVDGTAKTGPSLKGIFGQQHQMRGGSSVQVDENYIRESIMDPQAKVRDGYRPVMPTFKGILSDEEIGYLIEYIKSGKKEKGE